MRPVSTFARGTALLPKELPDVRPAQLRSPTGAPLHGRWRISGIGLPDDVLRKVYYGNALRYLPSVRGSIERQLAARR